MIFIHIKLRINQLGPIGNSPKYMLSPNSFKKSHVTTNTPSIGISFIFVMNVKPLKIRNGITNCFRMDKKIFTPPNF